ncbi:L-ascorbate peroxidase 2, cytosolic [Artemisia annua]|uniref:L-ascorbate peroxidase 2, cytosolic n=1 Tax=Artemisia annua TaxID=35608 RepID=A0A2U1KLS4_ARTAN|nr:L-ascorbate peroxidase 2, cytosolic [Artemisia annua]
MRHKAELGHGANSLYIDVRLLEPIKEQFPILSYGDLCQFTQVSILIEYSFQARFC